MRYLTATQVHNGKSWMPEGSVIEIAREGTVNAILPTGTVPSDKVEEYPGILCPGFVNAHCHLELSHMKGKISEGQGLIAFLKGVMLYRNETPSEEKADALQSAIRECRQNGIVAVGDIANGTDTLTTRLSAGMHIHSFVESTGFTEVKASERFSFSEKVYRQFQQQSADSHQFLLRQSIVPHAPYSVSPALFSLINTFDETALLSIHNQETTAENELYTRGKSAFDEFYRSFHIDSSFFKPSRKSSLQTFLPQLSSKHPVLLVHNTYMQQEDLDFLVRTGNQVYLCLCPNANWYIERNLPPLDLFVDSGLPICIGTDSLASNYQLSIWSELCRIRNHYKHLPLEELIRWATYNGARALDMLTVAGSLEEGKKPGIVHITPENNVRLLYPSGRV